MDNSDSSGPCDKCCKGSCEEKPRRPRKATLLNMDWIKERLAKAQRIKERLSSSSYQVDSEQIARALLQDKK